jgi:hypothetical protein
VSLFDDLISASSLEDVRTTVIGYAQVALLPITSWIVGDVGQQMLEVVTQLGFAVESTRVRIVRGLASLDTATDPGDDDPNDSGNAALDPAPGFLSFLGESTYGTVRTEETFAEGLVTFVNAGAIARTFKPFGLVFTWTANSPPVPGPTYRNAADATIYTNPDGSVTVPAGTSRTIPVIAEEIGSGSNTPANSLSLTTTLVGCTATNGAAVLAVDREDAEVYRTRCRQAMSRLSFGGPADALAYLAAKSLTGAPLLNASGNPVAINRAYVSPDSATGIVNAYFASPSGAASSEDVTAANDNIELNAFVIFDAITYTGAAAVNVPVTVAGTGKLRPGPGRTTAAAKAAIVAALTAFFETFAIGGLDQVAGAGVLYTVDLQAIAAASYGGLYDVLVATPAGATTALALGRVATLSTSVGSWTIT